MGRKKVGVSCANSEREIELRPFCYYCDREFDNAKTLVQHQRTKHFNCAECGARFDTVTGLRVHMLNAYKKTMREVPNAIPGRENPDIVVHGMEGLPKGLLEERLLKAAGERADRDRAREEDIRQRHREAAALSARSGPLLAPSNRLAAWELEAQAAVQREPNSSVSSQLIPLVPPLHSLASGPMQGQVPGAMQMQGTNAAVLGGAQGTTPFGVHGSLPGGTMRSPAVAGTPGPFPGAALPGLSPATARLLAGQPARGSTSADVPGCVGIAVPPALAGLHPIALQVLALAGVFPAPLAVGGGAAEHGDRLTA